MYDFTVYVAGPFRADSAWGIEQNIRRAENLALKVWEAGFPCVCPHTNTRFFQGALPDETWLAGDLAILKRQDAILMCEGWEKSSGAKIELEWAREYHLPIFFSVEELIKYGKDEVLLKLDVSKP